MSEPRETAKKLTSGVAEVIKGDNAYKAEVAAGIVDELFGSDPHAIVRSIAGVPEVLVETITDGIVASLKAEVLKRLNAATGS